MKLVNEPIDRAMVAKTHPSMYLMHKYWARKPHNVISEYIKYFTNVGDIVLDPFCGSGVTIAEALKLKRKAIGVDLNPMACFITEMTIKPIDIRKFVQEFQRLEKEVKPHIYDLYLTKCTKCRREAITTHTIWEGKKQILIRVECYNCGKKTERKPSNTDKKWIERIKKMKVPYFYPKDVPLHYSAKRQVEYIHELFEHRALIGLSILLHEIEKIKDNETREMMRFVFSSAISQASKLVFVIKQRGGKGKTGKYEVGSWTIQNIWVPPERFEINVWNCFEERFNKIARGKKDSMKEISETEWKQSKIYQRDARKLSFIQDEQIDYIFTDPPYGDAIPYFGMSLVWSSWLRMDMPFEKEILIREKSDKEKEFDQYKEALIESFVEMYRVLKPGGWLSVTFHNRNIKVWNALVSSAFEAGFSYENDVYQLPPRVSAKSLLHKSGSMTGDIYINFRKPLTSHRVKLQIGDPEKAIITESKEIISMRNGRATTDQIMRGVVSVLIKNNLLSRVENRIEDILKTNFVQVAKNLWALDEKQTYDPYQYIPLNKRLEYIIDGALSDNESHMLDDFLVRIFTLLKNGKTPESKEIMEILKKRAINKGDKWISKTVKHPDLFAPIVEEPLKPVELTKEETNEHGWFIAQLANLAYKMGFSAWVGKNEQNLDDKLQKLSIDRLEIAGIDEEDIRKNRIDQIDLIWIKGKNTPIALFEVENSTRGMTCIPRMGNLTLGLPHLRIQAYIVTPDKYERTIIQQLTSVSSRHIQRHEIGLWNYILYSDLLYNIEQFEREKITGEELLKRVTRIPPSN